MCSFFVDRPYMYSPPSTLHYYVAVMYDVKKNHQDILSSRGHIFDLLAIMIWMQGKKKCGTFVQLWRWGMSRNPM